MCFVSVINIDLRTFPLNQVGMDIAMLVTGFISQSDGIGKAILFTKILRCVTLTFAVRL